MKLELDRKELLTFLRLVEWRIHEHQQTMYDTAPEGVIECGTAENYKKAEQQAARLMPLLRKLRDAELTSRAPITGNSFPGMALDP